MKNFKTLFLAILILPNIVFAQKYILPEIPASDHLSINANVITVKNWGEKFDGEYDVAKLATDSCISGNCFDGKGRKVMATIINGNPRIRIMEGKFKNNAFLGNGVMLIDGYGKVLDGTYQLGKWKINYQSNDLSSATIFHSKFTDEDIVGNYSGYLDGGIGSALPEYRKFVIGDFAPPYSGDKKAGVKSTWEKEIYFPARVKWLNTSSPAFLAERAKTQAQNNQSSDTGDFKTYCFVTNCSSGGKTFDVVSQISANLKNHSFDEVKNEAIRIIKSNGWFANGNTGYLGIQSEVKIKGVAGKDYVVSGGGFYEFKKN
jgi:hypothetical protein